MSVRKRVARGRSTSNPLGPGRSLDVEQLLHSQRVRLLVAHHGNVVQPVEVGQSLEKNNTKKTRQILKYQVFISLLFQKAAR